MAHPVLCVGDEHVYGTPVIAYLLASAASLYTNQHAIFSSRATTVHRPIDRPIHSPPNPHQPKHMQTEHAAILAWLLRGHTTSPATGLPLKTRELRPVAAPSTPTPTTTKNRGAVTVEAAAATQEESVERALAYAPFLAEGDLARLADALAAAEARRGGGGE